jgi:hypothetical protein
LGLRAPSAGRVHAVIEPDDHGLKKERVIVSETQHGPVATDAAGPDAETGEADDVSEYSEEATGLDPAAEAADAASADGVSEDDPGLEADVEEEEKPDDAWCTPTRATRTG